MRKFIQLQYSPETQYEQASVWALDSDGGIWLMSLNDGGYWLAWEPIPPPSEPNKEGQAQIAPDTAP